MITKKELNSIAKESKQLEKLTKLIEEAKKVVSNMQYLDTTDIEVSISKVEEYTEYNKKIILDI